MKKLLLFVICLLFVSVASADNYFYVGENGRLRINPCFISGTVIVPVGLHLDGRIDSWTLYMTYPSGLVPTGSAPSTDMTSIPYLTSDGTPSTYQATLTSFAYSTFSSTITEYGYWDHNNDGIYEPFGTIKWEAGDHDNMFLLSFSVLYDCTGDTIKLDGNLSSTYDWRAGTTGGLCYSTAVVKFGYKLGDVNGDEIVNITDANYLISNEQTDFVNLDDYQREAADINGDGELNLTDIILLINILMNTNGLEGYDCYDDPIASILGSSGAIAFE